MQRIHVDMFNLKAKKKVIYVNAQDKIKLIMKSMKLD